MKKMFILKKLSPVLIILVILFFSIKMNTHIYVGDFSYYNPNPPIYAQIKVDGDTIYSDSLGNNPFKCIKLTRKLRYGIHTVHAISKEMNVEKTSKIFLLPNQFIIVEYHPVCLPYNEKATFSISTLFNPFYYE